MKIRSRLGVSPAASAFDGPLMVAAGVGWSHGQSHGSQADAPEALKLCLQWGGDQ